MCTKGSDFGQMHLHQVSGPTLPFATIRKRMFLPEAHGISILESARFMKIRVLEVA